MTTTSSELKELQEKVLSFRVTELQMLLGFANHNKSGRKLDLQHRALEVLRKNSGTALKNKIRELHHKRYPQKNSGGGHASSNKAWSRMAAGNLVNTKYQALARLTDIKSPTSPGYQPVTPPPPYASLSPLQKLFPFHPDVKMKPLPFYEVLDTLVKPTSLVSRGNSKFQEMFTGFHLTPDQVNQIASSQVVKTGGGGGGMSHLHSQEPPHYMVQVQLRLCLSETTCEQEDNYPPCACIKINSKATTLPSYYPQSKPGQEPKRPSRPVNLTPHTRLSSHLPNQVVISWNTDFAKPCGYTFGIFLVRQLTSENLMVQMKSKGRIKNADHTRALIKEKLSLDPESEIATTSLKVSLLCPLGKMRMSLPSRASSCSHLQCFDASLYIQMNEKKPTWICPVCDRKTPFSALFIDGLFLEILSESPDDDNIQFMSDGSWSTFKKDREKLTALGTPVKMLTPTSTPTLSTQPNSDSEDGGDNSNSGTVTPSGSKAMPEVIDLTCDSSDEEDDNDSEGDDGINVGGSQGSSHDPYSPQLATSPAPPAPLVSTPNSRFLHAQNYSDKNHSSPLCITIDNTPPRAPPSQPVTPVPSWFASVPPTTTMWNPNPIGLGHPLSHGLPTNFPGPEVMSAEDIDELLGFLSRPSSSSGLDY